MLHRYDESELLDLIEGELEERAAADLRQRLAADSRAAAAVERIMADRKALRSIEEPALPFDFLARLEPVLARPMLIESGQPQIGAKPGEFRRQYRRQTHRIRWGRLAAAAVLLFAVLGGVWAAVNSFVLRPSGLRSGELARNDGAVGNAGPGSPETLAAKPLMPEDGTIHHFKPMVAPTDRTAVAISRSPKAIDPAVTAVAGKPVVAEFAILVSASDASAVEQTVKLAVSTIGERSALVRNFSFDEAQKLAEEWRLAQGRSNDPNVIAAASQLNSVRTRADVNTLAERVRVQMAKKGSTRHGSGTNAQVVPAEQVTDQQDGQLAGPKLLAPSLEDQLDFSSRGAAYTIAVPASEAARMIEQLAMTQGQTTALRTLPAVGDSLRLSKAPAVGGEPLAGWMNESAQVRQAMQRIAQLPADTIVHVPVIVQVEPVKRSGSNRR